MSLVEVTHVEIRKPDYQRVRGFYLDQPKVGTRTAGHTVLVEGWVLDRNGPAVAVEMVAGGVPFRRVPMNMPRPDLARGFPEVPEAQAGGFRVEVPLAGTSELEFAVQAVLGDQTRVDIGVVRARRRFRESDDSGEPPLVSVVVPCFNQAHFLRDAVTSVLAQTYAHFEILVIDDGSTDNTAAVAAGFPGVRCVQQANQGLAAARNAGIRETTGTLLVFLDADDRLLPGALQAGIDSLREHRDCAFVWGRHRYIDGEGHTLQDGAIGSAEGDAYAALLRENIIGMHGSVMYRRSVFEAVRGFDVKLPAAEDYDLYLRIASQFPVAGHDQLVAEYRQHGSNMTRDRGLLRRAAIDVLRRQRRDLGQDPARLAACRAGIKRLQARRPSPNGNIPARVPPVGRVAWGDLRRTVPLSRNFGFDRGQPVDRYYIEAFLDAHAGDVRGRVLEIADNSYTRRFGREQVTQSDVLSLRAQPHATLVGDLASAGEVPSDTFDCFILTQTLHLIYDVRAALAHAYRILKPGGVLLATVPGITQTDLEETWHWGFTAHSVRRLFEEIFPSDAVTVSEHGNVLAAAALLYGLANQELSTRELDECDPRYTVTLTVRAVKPAAPRLTGVAAKTTSTDVSRVVEDAPSASPPRVSVVMIFLNAQRFMAEAIESVLAQTLTDWELILVDDGSTDGSSEVACGYAARQPGRIRCLEHPGHANCGMSASRNVGWRSASGKFVAFLDADDVWMPDDLAQRAALLEANPAAALVYGSTLVWHSWTGNEEDAGRDRRDNAERHTARVGQVVDPPELLCLFLRDGGALPAPCSVMIRRDALERVGGFDASFCGLYEDQVLFAKILAEAPVLVADACWGKYRQHGDSCCAQKARGETEAAARRTYLEWLEGYLIRRGFRTGTLWSAIQDALWPYHHPDALAEVLAVERVEADRNSLYGGYLELPSPGNVDDPHRVPIAGWALGRAHPVIAADIRKDGMRVRRVPIEIRRPDIAEAFALPDAAQSGFYTNMDLLTVGDGLLTVTAVLEDAGEVLLGTIRTRRRSLHPVRCEPARRSRRRSGRPVVLLYHRIGETAADPWGLAVSRQHFREHLEVLREYAHSVRLADLDDPRAVRSGPAVAITFDDGYADNLTEAFPLLQQFDWPATVFVTAGQIDSRHEFWWDELERLLLSPRRLPASLSVEIGAEAIRWEPGDAHEYTPQDVAHYSAWRTWQDPPTARHGLYLALYDRLRPLSGEFRREVMDALWRWAGAEPGNESRATHRAMSAKEVCELAESGLVDIGAHTLSHPCLATQPREAQREEVRGGKARLEEILGRPVTSFAYPFGRPVDYGAEAVTIVREAGYARACAALPGRVLPKTDRFQIPRCGVPDCAGREFARQLAGWISK